MLRFSSCPLWKEFLVFTGPFPVPCPHPPVKAWHPQLEKIKPGVGGLAPLQSCGCPGLREGRYLHPMVEVSGNTEVSGLEQTSKALSQTAR